MQKILLMSGLLLACASVAQAEDAMQTAALSTTDLPAATAPVGDTVEVPVLAHDVATGAIIAADDLTTAQVATRNVFAGTVHSADEAIGKQVNKNMTAGEPLLKMRLKTPSDVAHDSMVTLVFKRPGMELSGQAKALQDGKVGESIRVMNPETKTMLLATVTAPGQVEVR